MPSTRAENINNSFFDGYYKDIWRVLIPEALTKAEVDYLVNAARLKPGSNVLDLMCGYGRHALSLQSVTMLRPDNLVIISRNEIAGKENHQLLPERKKSYFQSRR
jgi:hypothetical protein